MKYMIIICIFFSFNHISLKFALIMSHIYPGSWSPSFGSTHAAEGQTNAVAEIVGIRSTEPFYLVSELRYQFMIFLNDVLII